MYFIGIDLAWTYKNRTGIVILNEDKELLYQKSEIFTNDDIVKIINSYRPNISSFDAPLVVKNEKASRACDRYLMKQKINDRYLKLYATSREYMMRMFGDIRGEKIVSDLGRNNTLLETFPTGVFLSLFPDDYHLKYKISSKNDLNALKLNCETLVNNINSLGFDKIFIPLEKIKTKVAYKKYEDLIDGYLCALTSYYHYINQSNDYCVDDNGCIVLPYIK